MRFSWLDAILMVMIIALVLWELRRDLGQSLFDTMALLLGLRLAQWLGPGLAPHLGMTHADQARGVALLLVFLVCTSLGLVAGYFLHRLTLWTLDQFDRVAGLVLGFSSAIILCHVLVSSVALYGTSKGSPPKYVKKSPLAQEMLSFRTCRRVVKFFNGLKA